MGCPQGWAFHAENRGAAVVGETYGSSAQNLEVFAADLAAVEQGETEPVGEDGAELLHEVEGECGFSGTQAVEVADVGVEADLFGGSVDEAPEWSVGEGEQGVDRVRGWSAVAVGEGRDALGGAECVGEGGEVGAGGVAFDAHGDVE
ncbi:hypothetical protein OG599_31880 [Streptomyces sp. NBC_01335]|nr:hypothetical protein OG599_31880 [Streptomyces sp. NBC_01335]